MIKPWYQSKTCWGSLFVGAGLILSNAGAYLLGEIEIGTAAFGVISGLGIILIAVGLRDAIDKKKL